MGSKTTLIGIHCGENLCRSIFLRLKCSYFAKKFHVKFIWYLIVDYLHFGTKNLHQTCNLLQTDGSFLHFIEFAIFLQLDWKIDLDLQLFCRNRQTFCITFQMFYISIQNNCKFVSKSKQMSKILSFKWVLKIALKDMKLWTNFSGKWQWTSCTSAYGSLKA